MFRQLITKIKQKRKQKKKKETPLDELPFKN